MPGRLKNNILNTESVSKTNITSDHYLVKVTIGVKLKSVKSSQQRRNKYRDMNMEEQNILNEKIKARPNSKNPLKGDNCELQGNYSEHNAETK